MESDQKQAGGWLKCQSNIANDYLIGTSLSPHGHRSASNLINNVSTINSRDLHFPCPNSAGIMPEDEIHHGCLSVLLQG